MSRPTHAAQQQTIDDATAAMPGSRFRWLFTPDPKWLAAVNTTTLREVNAVRMFVATTLLFVVSYVGVVVFALVRCGIHIRLLGLEIFQLLPPSGKLGVADWRLCEESLATARMFDFASGLFNSYGLILVAMASVAVGAMGIKRATDTEHRVKVEEAKKAPIILPPTSEHNALPPVQTTTVNVGEDAIDAGQKSATKERPTVPPKPKTEPDLYADDERGD